MAMIQNDWLDAIGGRISGSHIIKNYIQFVKEEYQYACDLSSCRRYF